MVCTFKANEHSESKEHRGVLRRSPTPAPGCRLPPRARLTGGGERRTRSLCARGWWRRQGGEVSGDSGLGDRQVVMNLTIQKKELGTQESVTAIPCLSDDESPARLAPVPSLPKSDSSWVGQRLVGRWPVSAEKPRQASLPFSWSQALKALVSRKRPVFPWLSPEMRQASARTSPQQQLRRGRVPGGYVSTLRQNPERATKTSDLFLLFSWVTSGSRPPPCPLIHPRC